MRSVLNRVLNRLQSSSPLDAEENAYRRLAARGYSPRSIIDVGAYQGDWTRAVRRVFPDSPILMVEAQPGKAQSLRDLCADLPGVSMENAVLAAECDKTVTFYEMETGSSLMPERSDVPRQKRSLTTRTLDDVASSMTGPVFLKLDVQGAELEVLKGGLTTLSRCDLVQLELALLTYNEGAPSFLEMIRFMDDHGFVPLDVANLTRPDRLNLAQVDFLFCPRDSTLRQTYFHFGGDTVSASATTLSG